METSRVRMGACILLLYICFAPTFFTHCDARKSGHIFRARTHSKPKKRVNLDISTPLSLPLLLDSTNTQPYGVSSPFSLPPFDSLAPIPLPENTPPFCEYPPFTPTIPTPVGGGGGYTPSSSPPPPSSTTPILPIQSPPPSPMGTAPSPPEIVPSPPTNIPSPSGYIPNPPIYVPSPTEPVLSPPYYEPSPPSYVPPPPPLSYVPSPTPRGHVPVFQPPVVYPPPTVPPPPKSGSSTVLWCVAKPSVPDPIIQEAMNYACGSGADCDSIQPNHPCFQPNTLFAHASYAFNSYWQRTKVAGGTCEFGGTAILVTVDPSYDGCHFVYY